MILKPTIRSNTFLDIINKKSIPTLSTDKNISFSKTIWSTVKKKEDLNIKDENLVLIGAEFPITPANGQVYMKESKVYIYKKNEDI